MNQIFFYSSVVAARKFVAALYDPKGRFFSSHPDLNKLRVNLATNRESSLIGLPPSESSFRQHVLKVCIQTQVWMSSHLTNPPLCFPYEFGWQKGKHDTEPVLFAGKMSSDFLQDLICSCKGRNLCSKACVCLEQNLGCTELCPCQGTEICKNELTKQKVEENEESYEVV